MKNFRGIVFDLYGTLYDVHSVAGICDQAYPGKGAAIAQLWRQKQLEYTWLRSLMERYVNFETLTGDALRFTCAALDLPLEEDMARVLADQYLRLEPHLDTTEALQRLKDAGIPLAIISNGSHKSIAHVVNHSGMGWAFDELISADDVQVFKPHPKMYELAERRMGHAREHILYVSANGWDASAASLAGFPVCWINRNLGPFDLLGATPTVVTEDLGAMADWVLE
ncbi:MAG: Haloacid dehalogenase type [Massilia sp.]|jgi:2-haloacid dehalogenase|nr:Haloacid dehalogenase type [Massilia sp.]MDB5948824.1 Haloacid dehalogenase type [Massilia sp.]